MVQRIAMAPQGPEFSRFVMGYWRLMDWKMSPGELVSFIEQHLDLGVTTVDHADIYGDYQCEAAFGEALKRAPHLRSRMEIVSKCGIATGRALRTPLATTLPTAITSCSAPSNRCVIWRRTISTCC